MLSTTPAPGGPSVEAQAALRLVAVGDIQENFLVPSYQRGYRWGEEQVRFLLDDIAAIQDKDYCLQPVVVKRLADGRFELIDGQQRLTTLYLILRYMQKEGFKKSGPPFSIAYATREQSGEFLQELDAARAGENIDFFHLHRAFLTIQKWFEKHGHRAEVVANEIFVHLGRRAKVIWYEAAPNMDSASLFTRLNVGRIPLTNAELVKALILGKSRERAPSTQLDQRRQLEIAMQWDTVERELHDRGLWSFLTNSRGDDYPTRIELLFELMADAPEAFDRFHTFFHFKKLLDGGQSPEQVWEAILTRYSQLKEWHDDGELYHRIGYLVATGSSKDDDLAKLIRESEGQTKSHFKAGLRAKITRRLDVARDELDGLEYEHDYDRCSRALLLFNVETTRKTLDKSFERYPFHSHKDMNWSLEHIHAQSAEGLNKKRQWQEWLDAHAKALQSLRFPDHDAEARATELVQEIASSREDVNKDLFTRLSARVTEMFNQLDASDDVHGIENLALLPSGANSALGNAVFEVKRQRILAMDRDGEYIPICTRRVFLKYYTGSGDQQLQFWSKQDRAAYLGAMTEVLAPYLKEPARDAGGAS